MNSFGRLFRITIFGESHGPATGVVMDGVPAGIPLCTEDFMADLARRRAGAPGTTPRREKDMPEFLSGLYRGHTTGAPLTIVFKNENVNTDDYLPFIDHPRPSHADLTATRKYGGYNDPRGGGHFSGRMTLPLVAAGVVAKKIMPAATFHTNLTAIGGCTDPKQFEHIVAEASRRGDSVGGIVECCVDAAGTGLGEPFFDAAESIIGHLLFAIPAVKGVEFGAGFAAASSCGSENNDRIVSADGTTASNHDGGINGGITNGNSLVVRAAVKPTPSISRPQQTFHLAAGQTQTLSIAGRHDTCIALRAAVAVEAAVAIALADLLLIRNTYL